MVADAIGRHRPTTTAGLGGSVVEIGFGSGLNVPYYPAEVTTVLAVDRAAVGQKLAAGRIGASAVPIEFVVLDGPALSQGDGSVDAALSTFTLCTIPDAGRVLDELLRVLRPGWEFHYLEHGLAADPAIAARHHKPNGFHQRVAVGCTIFRPIVQLVRAAGFEITRQDTDGLDSPRWLKPWNYVYEGVAITAN